ncbi:hypothetical protein FHT44_005156 [Mycolicibacterium sp. BK634]|uniref:hypothetical protein n=1 Tax=Mycolicibacterium sp. BK634 TaxID=2587099 RepID=UPI00161EC565|nr:hypothetical protein [Mycolicibacterium sp. BK634]MBB3752644.1 hypothetical protein [Mycolicibacterium sp. BK634]
MSELTDRAKAALEGVTEGPWNVVTLRGGHHGVSHGVYNFPTVVYAHSDWEGYGNGSSLANARFIAQARTLIPKLIAEIERLAEADICCEQCGGGCHLRSPNLYT